MRISNETSVFLRINRRDTVPGLQFCDYSGGQTGNLRNIPLFEPGEILSGKQAHHVGLRIPTEIRELS